MKARIIGPLLVILLVATGLRLAVLPIRVSGDSMEPNIHFGDFLLMKRSLICSSPVRRYDIVIARAGAELIVKRVIAFPGEWVRMTNGILWINGTPQKEPFEIRRGSWTVKTGQVAPGKMLLMGDNRELPLQCIYMLPQEAIIARQF